MTEQSFETLKVWQKSHQLMLDVHHKLLPLLPKEEKYGLADQVRCSSKSVGANIAEGAGRFYFMDNVRFCYMARGSLDETLNHLLVSKDLGFCENELYGKLRAQIEEIRRLLNGYITWLKTKKIGLNEPGANLSLLTFYLSLSFRRQTWNT
jgi:four helix bundle protein